MEKLLFSPTECRTILRISRSSMYNIIHSGTIKSIRINRKFFVTKKSLEEFIGMEITEEALCEAQ